MQFDCKYDNYIMADIVKNLHLLMFYFKIFNHNVKQEIKCM